MKHLLMLVALSALTSCGKYATKADLKAANNKIKDLQGRVSELESKVSANVSTMSQLSESLVDLSAIQLEVEQSNGESIDELQEQMAIVEATNNSTLAMIETLQTQTTSLLATQTALELEDRVIAVIDPCPSVSSTSYKESLFQMKSGKVIAYFEDGGKRFLTVLKTGTSYRTTDARACIFSL